MQYRREVDGLRAVAVLPVILFHAGMPFVNGGFVGVDVFFVISGYLITTILAQENAAGRFSLRNFYERRARRILPALFAVMLACLPFAWMWLLPADMQSFAQSLIGVSLFASNIVFWRTSGYFDTDSELTPLLHTWSLAVEEQYYVFFPLFLMLAWKLGRRWLVGLLGVGALLSLLAAQWGATHMPAATFYLLPTRGWELLIGAMVALYLSRPSGKGPHASEAGALTGLLLVTASIFAFDKHLPFPSFYALVPTVGAALIILCATPQTLVGRLLGSKPFVGIGLVSYSAYLWHQPLFAFARYKSTQEAPSSALMLGLAVLAMALAWLSWRFIETPTRDKQRFSRNQVWALSLVGTVGFLSLGAVALALNGFDSRLSPMQQRVAAYSHYDLSGYTRVGCFLEPEFLPKDFNADCAGKAGEGPASQAKGRRMIWGDSYAGALAIGMRRATPASQLFMQYTASACPPYVDVDMPQRPHCRAINDFALAQIAQYKPDEVVLHAEWHMYRAPLSVAVNLAATVRRIHAASPGSRIMLIGSVPQWPPTLPIYAIRKGAALSEPMYLPMPGHALLKTVDASLVELSARPESQAAHVSYVSALGLLCRDEGRSCLAVVPDETQHAAGAGTPVTSHALSAWDNGHLTEAGSFWLAQKLQALPSRP